MLRLRVDSSPIEVSARESRQLQREFRFRNVMHHLLVPSDFYEPIERYQPTEEYLVRVRSILSIDWIVVRRHIWFEARLRKPRPIPVQGWKIHLSTTPQQAIELLDRTARICMRRGVPFKFVCDPRLLMLANDKSAERGAAGKFVTIYPDGVAQFTALLNELGAELASFVGPLILSDRRFRDSQVVHYRYGGLTALEQLDEQGETVPVLIARDGHLMPDLRLPYFWLPPGVEDPVAIPDEESDDGDELTLRDGRYRIEGSLSHTNAGGVYDAIETRTGRRVVIKEPRPHTAEHPDGTDAVALRMKEWRILKLLEGTGIAPRPIELFWEWEHLFLVQDRVEGVIAGRLAVAEEMRSVFRETNLGRSEGAEHYRLVVDIARSTARAVDVLHRRNIVFGDLSPNNVLVTPARSVILVDFEAASEPGRAERRRFFTPGFSEWSRLDKLLTVEDDRYSLGCLILFLLAPINAMVELNPNAPRKFLADLEREHGLPKALSELVLALLDADERKRPTMSSVVAALVDLQLVVATDDGEEPRVSGPEAFAAFIPQIADYIEASLDLRREPHIFPMSPSSPNALNVAFGALGVVRSMAILGRDVADDLRTWIVSRECSTVRYPPGLYVGLAGIGWSFADLGETDRAIAVLDQACTHPLLFRRADIYAGAGGVGLACLRMWLETGLQRFLDHAVAIGHVLVAEGHESDAGVCWGSADAVPVGFARGASGIALFLLYLSVAVNDPKFLKVGRKALAFDLSYGVQFGGGLTFPEDTDAVDVVFPYWFMGTAGVGTTAVRYASLDGDSDLRRQVHSMAADCARRYTVFPGLFRGLAGLGNFLLDCHQLLKSSQHLRDAQRVAEGVMLFRTDRPNGIAFPGEDLYRITTDFASGSAGIGLFLDRLVRGTPNFNFLIDDLLVRRGPVEVPAS